MPSHLLFSCKALGAITAREGRVTNVLHQDVIPKVRVVWSFWELTFGRAIFKTDFRSIQSGFSVCQLLVSILKRKRENSKDIFMKERKEGKLAATSWFHLSSMPSGRIASWFRRRLRLGDKSPELAKKANEVDASPVGLVCRTGAVPSTRVKAMSIFSSSASVISMRMVPSISSARRTAMVDCVKVGSVWRRKGPSCSLVHSQRWQEEEAAGVGEEAVRTLRKKKRKKESFYHENLSISSSPSFNFSSTCLKNEISFLTPSMGRGRKSQRVLLKISWWCAGTANTRSGSLWPSWADFAWILI